MRKQYPFVNIVITSYNRRHFLKRIVEAVIDTVDYAHGFEINIIDNASQDGSVEYLQSLPSDWPVKVTCLNENKGVSGGRNVGLSLTANRPNTFYWSMDNDMLPVKKGWLEKIVEASMAQPEVHLISYPMHGPEDYQQLHFTDCHGFELAEVPPLSLGGYLMGIPAITFENVGYFDLEHARDSLLQRYCSDPILFGIEDTLYAHRVQMCAGKIYYMRELHVFQNLQNDFKLTDNETSDGKRRIESEYIATAYDRLKQDELARIRNQALYERLSEAYLSGSKPIKI